jgi:hypothetical protein
METTIVPRFVSKKPTKAGGFYFEVECMDGAKYTFFSEVEAEISKNIGKAILVEILPGKDPRFQNIRKFLGFATQITTEKMQIPLKEIKVIAREIQETKRPAKSQPTGFKFKDATMLTAYAKDLLIACIEKSEEKNWTAEKLTALREESGSQILQLYNDILSSL